MLNTSTMQTIHLPASTSGTQSFLSGATSGMTNLALVILDSDMVGVVAEPDHPPPSRLDKLPGAVVTLTNGIACANKQVLQWTMCEDIKITINW